MRVGIYNRWLATLGGGEKYSLTIAEYLSRAHDVTVITHRPVSKELAASRLNLDLSRVEFLNIPDRPAMELAPLTADYDLFISASFLDMFPSRAPINVLVVFFPIPLAVEGSLRLRRRVGMMVKRWLMVPSFDGVLCTEATDGAQFRQTGEQVKVHLPPSRAGYAVAFQLAGRTGHADRVQISLDDRLVEQVELPANGSQVSVRIAVPSHRAPRTLLLHADVSKPHADPYQMALSNFWIDHPRYRVYRWIFERWFSDWGLKLYRIPAHVIPLLQSVDTYDAIWAISKFTQTWIKRYWNRPSTILYPPIEADQFRVLPKRKRILSVGRFFEGSHNKKHRDMVAAFRRMVQAGLTDWELHLAGGVSTREADVEYLNAVRADGHGLPVFVHANIAYKGLLDLYGTSAIYWHASGLGEDEVKEPIKFEHFGITSVEAMAAGCVPVVINNGGLREIVQHGRNGFLWGTPRELEEYTFELVHNSALRQRLATAAVQSSREYDKIHFNHTLQRLLREIKIFD